MFLCVEWSIGCTCKDKETKLYHIYDDHIKLMSPFSFKNVLMQILLVSPAYWFNQQISWSQERKYFEQYWLTDQDKAFSSILLQAIIACYHLPFFKIILNFVYFCPNFHVFPFLPFLKTLLPYFLKYWTYALTI